MPKSVLAFAVLGVLAGTMVLPAGASVGLPGVPFVTVAQGRTSGVRQPLQMVIRDREAWLALWRRHTGSSSAPAPSVDFSREIIIAVFGGTGVGTRAVTITQIARGPTQLTVWYVIAERSPLPDGGQAPGTPFHIVRLARSSLPVVFLEAKIFPVVPQP